MRFSTILTPDQAALLFDLVKEHRMPIVARRSYGVWDGLLMSLSQIDRGGGAFLRNRPSVLDYGGDIIEATIIPPSTYIALLGIRAAPGPSWDLAFILPQLSVEHEGETKVWKPVTIYCTRNPLAVVPLAAAVLPADNPLSHIPAP